eukprot:scaffold11241_cov148-Skeletonema_marinoi.AAC.5
MTVGLNCKFQPIRGNMLSIFLRHGRGCVETIACACQSMVKPERHIIQKRSDEKCGKVAYCDL